MTIETFALPVSAFIISLATLGFSLIQLRYTAKKEYVADLERRIEKLEKTLEDKETQIVFHINERTRLEQANAGLMRQVLQLQVGKP